MAQLTVQEVQQMIADALKNQNEEVKAIKIQVKALDAKLKSTLKAAKISKLSELVKEFDEIKNQSNAIAKQFGAIDMNDLSVVVDAEFDNLSFNVGDFTFSAKVKTQQATEETRPEQECKGAIEDHLERYEFVKIAGVDPWKNYQNHGKKDGRTWDMSKCKNCTQTNGKCSLLK